VPQLWLSIHTPLSCNATMGRLYESTMHQLWSLSVEELLWEVVVVYTEVLVSLEGACLNAVGGVLGSPMVALVELQNLGVL